MNTKIAKIPAEALRVLRALVAGGRVEFRRTYPFPGKHHLIRLNCEKSPPGVSDRTVVDLVARGLIRSSKRVSANDPRSGDSVDYLATATAVAVVEQKGVIVEDAQLTLIDEPTRQRHATMDSNQ